ncbi:MAG: ABC transporter substrate-binding protein [Gemmatimonadota bacterium]
MPGSPARPGVLALLLAVALPATSTVCGDGSRPETSAARAPADGGSAPRIVSLDYALTATLLELGVPPVGVPDHDGYGKWVVEPELPPDVVDVGSTFEPNLELIQQLEPDLILTTPFLADLHGRLERIAPTVSMAIYAPEGEGPLRRAREVTRRLGERLEREDRSEELIARVDSTLGWARDRVASHRERPLYLVRFMDPRHVRVFGEGSLYDDVLERVGVPNAWRGETNYWGFSTVGIEGLATDRAVRLFFLEPPPPDVLPTLEESGLWNSLPFVRAGRVHPFPMVLMFGGLPAAERFARLLVRRLEQVEAPGG